jgi:hypothetical protein
MAKDSKERETISFEELALSNAYQLEAIINVLERKGLLTSKEVLEEMEDQWRPRGRRRLIESGGALGSRGIGGKETATPKDRRYVYISFRTTRPALRARCG